MKKAVQKRATKNSYIQHLVQKTGEQRLLSALKLTEFIHWLHQEGKKSQETYDLSRRASVNN